MLSKKEIKDIQSLRSKKFREEMGLFVAEGPKIVTEFLTLIPKQIIKIFALEEWVKQHQVLLSETEVELITTAELEKISGLQTPNEVVALIKELPVSEPGDDGIALYLDSVQDPGNFGTIIRIADWFGIKNIICTEGCADRYNPKVIQSTMSSIARVNIFYDEELNWLKRSVSKKYAATLAGTSVYNMNKLKQGIIIIGNESKGIRDEILQLVSHQITIPKKGAAESLNAAVATGIILSHLVSN